MESRKQDDRIIGFQHTCKKHHRSRYTRFMKLLKDHGYLHDQKQLSIFRAIFFGGEIVYKTDWRGTKGELAYMFREMFNHDLLVKRNEVWRTVAACFTVKGKSVTADSLKRSTKPVATGKLDSIIKTLRSSS